MSSILANTALRGCKAALSTLAIAAMATAAHADIITNGNFTTSSTVSSQLSEGSYTGVTLSGWTSANGAYNFVFVPNSSAANSQYGNANVTLKGAPTSDPSGGNFVALDSDYDSGSLSQTLTGLSVGTTYQVTFDVASAQQTGYPTNDPNGPETFTQTLQVSLSGVNGTESDTITGLTYTQPGVNGWTAETVDFTSTSATETLSFLAGGAPTSLPSFVLLDNVSASPVPEPGSLALLSTGLLGLGGLVRSRFKR